jgi:ribonuclease BN (tRNA processing enzyme)
MRLTVLGKSPSWEDAGGACSGYLLEAEGRAVVIDCGNGVFSKLRRFRDYTRVDAVLVSHLHADHFLDLIPWSYALTYAPRQQPVPVDRWEGTQAPARPRLIAPVGARDVFRRVAGAWGPEELVENAFALEEYEERARPEEGALRFRFRSVPHFAQTFACRVTADDEGASLVFGADSGPNDALVEFAEGADLLLAEATLPRPEREGPRGHMTAREAGDHAARAGVGRLVLTHISDELDALAARKAAAEAFGGPVEVAREGATFEV